MKEKLIIKNFGPIKSVDLDLGKITVFIGEQATGKSTVAKVLSMCRYFSYIIENVSPLILRSRFIEYGLSEWDLTGFENKNTLISYENKDYLFQVEAVLNENQDLDYFSQKLKPKTKRFEELINKLKLFKIDNFINPDSKVKIDWNLPYNFLTTDVKNIMNNPFYFPTERGLQSIFSLGKSSIQYLSDSLFKQLADLYNISLKFKNEIEIEPLDVYYKNDNGKALTRKRNETEYYKLSNGASGYKSTIPIVLTTKFYNENEKRSRTFIVEEPEQNLFPTAQKKLVEFLVKSINSHNNQFILPTHSPYILTTLINLIYAHKVGTLDNGRFEEEVCKIIPKESWIDVNDISVYFLNNGEARDLVDEKECLINLDDLDNVSEIINDEFDRLLAIDMELEKETQE